MDSRSANDFRDRIHENWEFLAEYSLKDVAVVGAGPEGQKFCEVCRENRISLCGVYDDDPKLIGSNCSDYIIQSIESMDSLARDSVVVVATHRLLNIMRRLRDTGFSRTTPLATLQILWPERFPPHMFYSGWCADLYKNREKYIELFELLSDEKSLLTLDAVLLFRLSLEPENLRKIIEPEHYFPNDLTNLSNEEVFIDGGAFDGDTAQTFIRLTNNQFKKIIAFEPDKETYSVLRDRFSQDNRIETINMGLYSGELILRFRDGEKRASVLDQEGATQVQVTNIDNVVGPHAVSYIKMNIEGAEIAALEGSRDVIQKSHPFLSIAAYHNPSDLHEIPGKINTLDDSYDLFLRQHGTGVVETVIYGR